RVRNIDKKFGAFYSGFLDARGCPKVNKTAVDKQQAYCRQGTGGDDNFVFFYCATVTFCLNRGDDNACKYNRRQDVSGRIAFRKAEGEVIQCRYTVCRRRCAGVYYPEGDQ